MPEEQVPYGDEDRDKVCPLRMIGHANGGGYLARPRCLKEECAWRDDIFSKCAIASVIYQLVDIEQQA